MTGVEQVWDYRFPGIDMPIATFCRRVSEIAERNGCTVETWEEDGLGEASGLMLKLASGRTILSSRRTASITSFGCDVWM